MKELLSLNQEILGETCGIFAGNGSMYTAGESHVLEVRGNKEELEYYKNRVKWLFDRILSRETKIIKRSYQGGYLIGIRSCDQEAIQTFHVMLEFPIGKRDDNFKIPKVIVNNHEYWPHYIRGIFDTNGSVYLRRTGRKYQNPVIDISSSSIEHLKQLKEILKDIGFNFWLEESNSKIRMAGYKNTQRFFKVIKPHNNTKIKKQEEIMLRWLSG
ncbi:MAG: hypothetical protein KAS04_04170 [Candidatus Aenigmarchaeota archaeon]|nr:hypothetical protein [Candidatus Aenigmarchaeota archaeon]